MQNNKIKLLRVDGGASNSVFLMQFQADILDIPVERPTITEMTAQGACFLAGLGAGIWQNYKELERYWQLDKKFLPAMDIAKAIKLYSGWKKAVNRSFMWQEPEI